MQTIEEYKAYTKQLEDEVGKWHHAYDALVIERNMLVRKILETENSVSVKDHENGCDCVMLTKEAFEAMSNELEELRKHEVAWDTDKAQIKVYEQRLAEAEEIDNARMKYINDCEKACKEMSSKIDALETELEQSKYKKQWK